MRPLVPTLVCPELLWTGGDDAIHRNVGVLVDGMRITRVMPADAPLPAGAARLALPGRLLTPGLTNFHAHLELTDVPRPLYPGTFLKWIGVVMAEGPKTGAAAGDAAAHGALWCVKFGVTGVVDVTRFPAETRSRLARVGIDVRSCGEVTGLARRLPNGRPMLDAAKAPCPAASPRVHAGVSPHAPYSTDAAWYQACAELARGEGLTMTTHLAETPEEREFLAHHRGPFRELWDRLGDWSEDVGRFEAGPVRWLAHLRAMQGTRLLAAHVNDVTDDELALLAENDVTVVHCPRTHAYFRRPPFDAERYRRAGVTLKLGTDSAASSGDLNLMEDVRLFRSQNQAMTASDILSLVIDRPLAPGAFADMVAWPTLSLDELVSRPVGPAQVWVAGRPALIPT